jgi:putative addiction module antidote
MVMATIVATIVEITSIGDAAGIVLPREVMDKLHVEKGDKLYLTATAGGLQITPHAPDFDATMAVARNVMRRYDKALTKLAE